MNEAYSRDIWNPYTKVNHRNFSAILITQNLFHHVHFSMYTLTNAKYLFRNLDVRDRNQLAYLAMQVFPENSNGLYERYL
jgi:hypothetical protein